MKHIIILFAFVFVMPLFGGVTNTSHSWCPADQTRVHPATTPTGQNHFPHISMPSRQLLDGKALLPAATMTKNSGNIRATELLGQASIRFQENRGQFVDTDGKVRRDIAFVANAPGAKLFFRNDGISYVFSKASLPGELAKPNADAAMSSQIEEERSVESYRMDMTLVGSNPFVRIRAEGELPGYVNYYLPYCPDGITGVKEYSRIVYENVYDNVDFELFSVNGKMKYNFVVRPGGNITDIRMQYEGATETALTNAGDLAVATPLGRIEEATPYTYSGSKGNEVASRFLRKGNTVSFDVGDYDQTQALVIDPWATYYGGSGSDHGYDVASDPSGNIYVTGRSGSTNFPVTSGAYQTTPAGGDDIFVMKFNSSGLPVWVTYYGGTSGETGRGIAVDQNGNVDICGDTNSTNFPVSQGAFQARANRSGDIFIVQLNNNGSRNWATYYGGSKADLGHSIATDGNNNIVITGFTGSKDFPVTSGAFQSSFKGATGYNDAYLVKFTGTGSRVWATYYGGSAYDQSYDVTVDAQNNILFTGTTSSANFPVTSGNFQSTNAGFYDGFLVKFASNGTRAWATYFGGSGAEDFQSLVTDEDCNVYLCGSTGSLNFPVTPGAFQATKANAMDAMAVKLSSNGGRIWATYCGGTYSDAGYGITVDPDGSAVICGTAGGADFPVCNALQPMYGGNTDGFITKFNPLATAQIWSTFYGGSSGDQPQGIARDGSGNIAVTGYTTSTNFPTFSPVQAVHAGGGYDLFIVQLNANGLFSKQSASRQQIPSSIVLEQNYPNPFNPTTTIQYGIPEDAAVLLRVFDINGRPVAELVNGMKKAGSYNVLFHGDCLPSGVYLYRLEANGQTQTRTMILMK